MIDMNQQEIMNDSHKLTMWLAEYRNIEKMPVDTEETIDRRGEAIMRLKSQIDADCTNPREDDTILVPKSAIECQKCQNGTKVSQVVPNETIFTPDDTLKVPKVSCGTDTDVVPIWETLGVSRRTYYRHKNKGVIKNG